MALIRRKAVNGMTGISCSAAGLSYIWTISLGTFGSEKYSTHNYAIFSYFFGGDTFYYPSGGANITS
jgi:hypothetical protein